MNTPNERVTLEDLRVAADAFKEAYDENYEACKLRTLSNLASAGEVLYDLVCRILEHGGLQECQDDKVNDK